VVLGGALMPKRSIKIAPTKPLSQEDVEGTASPSNPETGWPVEKPKPEPKKPTWTQNFEPLDYSDLDISQSGSISGSIEDSWSYSCSHSVSPSPSASESDDDIEHSSDITLNPKSQPAKLKALMSKLIDDMKKGKGKGKK